MKETESLEQKIKVRLIWVAILSILLTAVCVMGIYYRVFQQQVMNDLRISAELLREDEDRIAEDHAHYDSLHEIRITLIDRDGTVLYDNESDASGMKNHAGRPEVKEAMEDGSGSDVRHSATMQTSTYYYALRCQDGRILRLSRETRGILALFETAVRPIVMLIAALALLSVVFARYITQKIMKPINEMAKSLGNYREKAAYREMQPFLETIRSQHDHILEAAKMRQDFTANVSHELKTPLTAIGGYAELIENHMVSPNKAAEFCKEIRRNAERLLSLINDIIELSELDRKDEEVQMEDLDLYQIASECAGTLSASARKNNISLRLEGEHCMVHGNRSMLAELINNLGENAIRYNNEFGSVVIKVKPAGKRTMLIVQDNGIGIPEDKQSRVFERFYRVDKSRSRARGGTGLGLSIVKHIADLHDAEIRMESRVGEGTIIRVLF